LIHTFPSVSILFVIKMAKLPFPYVRAKLYTHSREVVNRKINEVSRLEKGK